VAGEAGENLHSVRPGLHARHGWPHDRRPPAAETPPGLLIEDKPGASGNTGTDAVARRPDGYTLGISIGGPLAINRAVFARCPTSAGYHDHREVATQPTHSRSGARLGVDTVAELIALLKKNPATPYNFGSIGNGSLSHLAMAAIALATAPRSSTSPMRARPGR
jgi:tripartite-type tricarboxylate transporter receptor subunit TctC